MSDSIRRIVIGGLLILLGLAFFLRNMGIVSFEFRGLWPWLLILPGLIFWGVFIFDRSHFKLILPGTILLTYGLLFLSANTLHLGRMENLWPVFILGPGLGFLLMYFLGEREAAHLRTGVFLSLLSLAFFLLPANPELFWPVLLIGLGVFILMRGFRETALNEKQSNQANSSQQPPDPEKD